MVHNLCSNIIYIYRIDYNYTHAYQRSLFIITPCHLFTTCGIYSWCGVGESFIFSWTFWSVCVCRWEWSFTFVIASIADLSVFAHFRLVCCVAWRPSYMLSQCIVWWPALLCCVVWWCPCGRRVSLNRCYCLWSWCVHLIQWWCCLLSVACRRALWSVVVDAFVVIVWPVEFYCDIWYVCHNVYVCWDGWEAGWCYWWRWFGDGT